MRTLWITKKATQPFSFQSAGCIFKNPRGISAGLLIDQAGLKGTRIGQAEISEPSRQFHRDGTRGLGPRMCCGSSIWPDPRSPSSLESIWSWKSTSGRFPPRQTSGWLSRH
ncbi:MAG: hypothetical protein U0903_09755 [Planctomycetales bacterium]